MLSLHDLVAGIEFSLSTKTPAKVGACRYCNITGTLLPLWLRLLVQLPLRTTNVGTRYGTKTVYCGAVQWLPRDDPLRSRWRNEGPFPLRHLYDSVCPHKSPFLALQLSKVSDDASESTSAKSHPVKTTGYFGLSVFDTLYQTSSGMNDTDAVAIDDVCKYAYIVFSSTFEII